MVNQMKDSNFRNADIAYLYLGRVNSLNSRVKKSLIRTIMVYVITTDDNPDGLTRVVAQTQLSKTRDQNFECFSGHVVDIPSSAWCLVDEETWDKLQADSEFRKEYQRKYSISNEVFNDFIHGRDALTAGENPMKVIKNPVF